MSRNQNGYLFVPVWPNNGGEKKLLRILRGDELWTEFLVPDSGASEGRPAWHAALPLQKYDEVRREDIAALGFGEMQMPGEASERDPGQLCCRSEDDGVRAGCFVKDLPEEGAALANSPRPAVHFTPSYGWMNDPNGLVFDGKVWHLFFQHNPMDIAWSNMTWGHAVSEDLVHFSWKGDVLLPDARGVMYSGCAVVNGQKLEDGVWRIFPELPEEALLFFYTSAGGISPGTASENSVFTQRAAFSVDGGETLVKIGDWEIPNLAKENRDPKVILHPESRGLIMALYLDADIYGLYRAEAGETDGPHFKLLQKIWIPQRIECPDFFPLTDPESGRVLWAFVSSNGHYQLGEFDGYVFKPVTGWKDLYANQIPFAAQSWSNAGGRVFSIAWLRSFNDGRTPWTGAMSLVREFTLARKEDGPYIRQHFVLEDRRTEGYGLPKDVERRKLPDGAVEVTDTFGGNRIVERLSADGSTLDVESTLPVFPYPVYVEGKTH